MELILLSIFGIGFLLALELCGLFYKQLVREPYLTHQSAAPMAGQFPPCSEAANDPDATTIVVVRSRSARTNRAENEHA